MDLQLRTLRKRSGLTQEQLASRISVSARMVSSWERGEVGLGLDDACLIADFFGVTLDELAGRIPPQSATPEGKLIGLCREMSPEGQEALVASARGLRSAYPAKK